MRLITLALGGAIGYVLGAKAGHGRYEQLVGLAQRMGKGQKSTSNTDWASSNYTSTGSSTTGPSGMSSSGLGDTFDSPLNT